MKIHHVYFLFSQWSIKNGYMVSYALLEYQKHQCIEKDLSHSPKNG